jgi:hypothetical protein
MTLSPANKIFIPIYLIVIWGFKISFPHECGKKYVGQPGRPLQIYQNTPRMRTLECNETK